MYLVQTELHYPVNKILLALKTLGKFSTVIAKGNFCSGRDIIVYLLDTVWLHATKENILYWLLIYLFEKEQLQRGRVSRMRGSNPWFTFQKAEIGGRGLNN